MELNEVKNNWEKFGEVDPLFAILTDPSTEGGRWDVKEFFATGAEEVERIMNMVDSLGLSLQHDRALDFGCGVGRLTQPLGIRFREVVGIDISSSMIGLATRFNTVRSYAVVSPSDGLAK